MTTLLRAWPKLEWEALSCDPWEQCPRCKGRGLLPAEGGWGVLCIPCADCEGHGSAKAMAFARALGRARCECTVRPYHVCGRCPDRKIRCEGCGHPMSEGTWWYGAGLDPAWPLRQALDLLRQGIEPVAFSETRVDDLHHPGGGAIHYSPCDEGCRHGGPGRIWDQARSCWVSRDRIAGDSGYRREASWRPVDARRLSWDDDLRPEQTAVLCLRCFTERTKAPLAVAA